MELSNDHPENILSRDRPVNAAVSGVHAIVAEKKILILAAHDELFLNRSASIRWRRIRQVRLVKFGPVDVNGAVFQKDGIAADTDDALDREAFGGRIANDDDVLAGGRAKMVNPTIEQVVIGVVKGRDHAGANYSDGLDEVVADDVVAAQTEAGDDEALKNLPKKTAPKAFGVGFGGRAIDGRFCRERLRFWHWQVRKHYADRVFTWEVNATRGKIT